MYFKAIMLSCFSPRVQDPETSFHCNGSNCIHRVALFDVGSGVLEFHTNDIHMTRIMFIPYDKRLGPRCIRVVNLNGVHTRVRHVRASAIKNINYVEFVDGQVIA